MCDIQGQLTEMKTELENIKLQIELIKQSRIASGKSYFNPLNINVVNTYIELPHLRLEQTLAIVQECFELCNWEIEELFRPSPELEMHRTIRDVCMLALTQMGWQLGELREIFRMHQDTVSDRIKKIRRRIIAEEGLKEEYRQLIFRIRNAVPKETVN
jgi:hypothetical protein